MMGKSYFFVRMVEQARYVKLYEMTAVGALEKIGIGTEVDPEGVWVVLGTKLETAAEVTERLRNIGFGHLVKEVRSLASPDEGASMAKQLALFN